jgi:hypothetical protein
VQTSSTTARKKFCVNCASGFEFILIEEGNLKATVNVSTTNPLTFSG